MMCREVGCFGLSVILANKITCQSRNVSSDFRSQAKNDEILPLGLIKPAIPDKIIGLLKIIRNPNLINCRKIKGNMLQYIAV